MLLHVYLSTALVLPDSAHLSRRAAVLGAAAAVSVSNGVNPSFAAATGGVEKTWRLAGGVLMPTLALNTAGLSAEGSELAFKEAVAAGISHVDFHPGIERDGVAKALKSLDRSKVFLTTKIRKPPPGTTPADAAELVRTQLDEDLAVLGLSQVDMLMLRDSPDCAVMQAQWKAVEEALKSKRAKSIGVINYCQSSLECILATATTKPSVNYIMEHVGMGKDTNGLRAFGESKGIRTFAYGALGEPGPSDELLNSPILRKIGDAHGRTTAEVALRWGLQSGCAVSVRPTADFGLGKSTCTAEGNTCSAGLRTRARAFDWALTSAEMEELTAMTSPAGNPTLFSTTFCPDSFFAQMQAKK